MARLDLLKEWGVALRSMIFPRVCEVCSEALVRGEDVMCMQCDYEMPRCRLHNESFNAIHRRLAGHVPVERAAAMFHYYRDTPYTRLIHVAKYNGRPLVVRKLACKFALEILPDGFFDGIDMILPVPLHRVKRLKRGYNQSDYIARGISEATDIPVADNLVAVRSHGSQTHRGAFERWLNSRDIYQTVRPDELAGRHLLVVDDVITTGSTMLACCEAIHEAAPTATISVLSLGLTSLA